MKAGFVQESLDPEFLPSDPVAVGAVWLSLHISKLFLAEQKVTVCTLLASG